MQPKLTLNLHYVLMCGRKQYDGRMGWGEWMREDGAKIWFELIHRKLFVKAQHKVEGRTGQMEVGVEHLIEKRCLEH